MFGDKNEFLGCNDALLSANRLYILVYRNDGNLAIYLLVDDIQEVWTSGSATQNTWRTYMQPDGNFVVYSAFGQAGFSTNTEGNPGAYIVMEDSGCLVVYDATGNQLWTTPQPPSTQQVTKS
jgi:hypothetical protein